MTQEFEWSVYDKRSLLLNKERLMAIGDRNFPFHEKRLELQHPNVEMLPAWPSSATVLAGFRSFCGPADVRSSSSVAQSPAAQIVPTAKS